jgi:glycosyltransferase involved in cell wall biosynthesis
LTPRKKSGGISLFLNYLSFAFFASLIGPFACKGSFDLIFVYEPSPVTVCIPAIVIKKIKSAPIFFWVQDLWPQSLSATGAVKSKFILNIVDKFVRFLYKRCDKVLVQSEAFINHIECHDVDRKDIYFFPNNVENVYRPVDIDEVPKQNILPSGFKIIFAGNIGAAQDFSTIISAAKKIKDKANIQWVILGDGRMKAWAEQKVQDERLLDIFHFLGRFPMEDMPYFFAQADAMLVSLKKDPIFSMTIPAKVQSYMACGKPIIACLEGEGAKLINRSCSGLVSEPGNVESLSQTALEMFDLSDEQRSDMGKKGKEYCHKNFDREKLLNDLELWMKEVAS